MQIILNTNIASNYTSPSQKIRVMTEHWVETQAYCPSFGSGLKIYQNNNPVGDFYCPCCREDYELKSKWVEKIAKKIVEKRKPLSKNAQRANWIGCNILLNTIPDSRKIFYIRDKHIYPKEKVIKDWRKTLFLREIKTGELKGRILNIMKRVNKLRKPFFTLSEIYSF